MVVGIRRIGRDYMKGASTEADAQHLQDHSAGDEQRPEGYSLNASLVVH